jgi:hypothetical protein
VKFHLQSFAIFQEDGNLVQVKAGVFLDSFQIRNTEKKQWILL